MESVEEFDESVDRFEHSRWRPMRLTVVGVLGGGSARSLTTPLWIARFLAVTRSTTAPCAGVGVLTRPCGQVLRFALRGLVLACSLQDVIPSVRLVRGYIYVGKDSAFASRGTGQSKSYVNLIVPQNQFIDRLLIFQLCHRDGYAQCNVQKFVEIPRVPFVSERVVAKNAFDGFVCAAKEAGDNGLIKLAEDGKEQFWTPSRVASGAADRSSTSLCSRSDVRDQLIEFVECV